MKYLFKLLIIFAVLLVGCSDNSDNGESPQSQTDKLVGYWAISHIKTIEHTGGLHNTDDSDVPPHGLDSYASDENYRYDVLIFDEEFVTVRGDMPNRPKQRDYDDLLNMGAIKFTSNNEFTLDYTKSLSDQGDYRRLIYTYTRIYSLTL